MCVLVLLCKTDTRFPVHSEALQHPNSLDNHRPFDGCKKSHPKAVVLVTDITGGDLVSPGGSVVPIQIKTTRSPGYLMSVTATILHYFALVVNRQFFRCLQNSFHRLIPPLAIPSQRPLYHVRVNEITRKVNGIGGDVVG